MLRHNLGYKLIALGIGLTIWAYSNGAQSARVSREIRDIPLRAQNLEPGCSATLSAQTVSVALEGERADVNAAATQTDGTSAHVNLQGKRSGTHTLPVQVSLPSTFAGLVSAQASPREVRVTIRERSQRSMDVQAQFTIAPPAGYEFAPAEIAPARITVSGPAERVRQVSKVVAIVDQSGPEADRVAGDFAVYALDREGKHVPEVALSPDKVKVSAGTLQLPASRLVFVSLSVKGQPPFPYRVAEIEIQPQTVNVTGKPAQLAKVTTVRTETLDLSNRTATFHQRVPIIVPEGLSLTGERVVRATVRIETVAEPDTTAAPSDED